MKSLILCLTRSHSFRSFSSFTFCFVSSCTDPDDEVRFCLLPVCHHRCGFGDRASSRIEHVMFWILIEIDLHSWWCRLVLTAFQSNQFSFVYLDQLSSLHFCMWFQITTSVRLFFCVLISHRWAGRPNLCKSESEKWSDSSGQSH